MSTPVTKQSTIKRHWHLIDLDRQTLGRASSHIAQLLIGKHKPYFTPNLDCGDYVVVINASNVEVTGKKRQNKLYRHHSGHPGGFREYTFQQVQAKDPARIIELAVKGMLPKNKLRDRRLKRLKIFAGSKHPYLAQLSTKE